MKAIALVFFLFLPFISDAQSTPNYQASTQRKWDLLHTKLELTPDWQKQQLLGQATLTIKPHFYPQKEILLNAKSFVIQSVKLLGSGVEYTYDGNVLSISLLKEYARTDTLKIDISYLAKPNEIQAKGSEAITLDKGLYFVGVGSETQQLWTQGETQANSCWFPTFDTPNEKHTQDIYLRVDTTLTTLSNGELVEKILHNNGTRTDHWQMKQPHSVYLTMIAAGNFIKTTDPTFTDFEVSYYLEPNYAPYAQEIFGRTPEMILYFEQLLGVKYPWSKYSQIAVREFVSGAMENTTATVHGDFVMKTPNQLVDNNDDGVIAHELFHHWFGDLVTAESWANLPLNESFADYSEYLWASHFYGQDAGDWVALKAMENYLLEAQTKQVPLIRYSYADKEEMFDSHSYAKGGRILHMLRRQIGDEAFFTALTNYLQTNAYKNTEVHNLRMAFEEVTGQDLNWFFNQWFLAAGHPRLEVEHYYKKGKLTIEIDQKIDSVNALLYELPVEIMIGTADGNVVKKEFLTTENAVYTYDLKSQPLFVLIDPRGELVGEINHPKTNEELINQYQKTPEISGRIKALERIAFTPETDELYSQNPLQKKAIRELVIEATKDTFWGVRDAAVQKLFDYDGEGFLDVEKALQFVIKTDKNANVRADAILAMKNFLNPQNDILFRAALSDTSFAVRGAALEALLVNNPPDAAELVLKFESINDINIFASVASFYADQANPSRLSWFMERFRKLGDTELYQVMGILGTYLIKSERDTQLQALPFLEHMATANKQWFLRYSAVQTLLLVADLPETKASLKKAFATETDERLKSIYKNYTFE